MMIFAALATVAFTLIYLSCDGRPYLAAFVVLLAALASAPFWGVRPQVFNMAFAAALVFLLEGFKDGKIGRRTLFLVPLLTLLWANLHSGYLLGIVLLATYVLGEWIQLRFGKRADRGLDRQSVRWLAMITVLSFIAAVLNPNGPELWIYPFFTLGSVAMQEYILEWQSPNFHQSIFWPFAAMLALGMISVILGRRRLALTELLLFTGTAAAGLLSARHIPLFAIVSSPIIARHLLSAFEENRLYPVLSGSVTAEMSRPLRVLNLLILIFALVAAVIWVADKAQKNDDAISERFPVAAVDYLESSGLAEAKGYNSYNWGGYLIWRDIPVFVDGRADVYGDDFLYSYRRTFDLTALWKEPLDEYDVSYVLIESYHSLTTLLAESNQWEQAYSDDVASIYIRTD
jgi:hypothetical protein